MNKFIRTVGASVVIAMVCAGAASAAAPPVTTLPPTIEGAPIVGRTLTATNGLWRNGPDTFSYRWMRCDANGNNCTKISGATSKTYVLVTADVGHTILVLVTAKNDDGSQTANSHPTGVVTKAVEPASKTPPTITGKAVVGAQLVADAGTYGGGAVEKYTFQWRRCDNNGGGCADVSGATGQSYGVRSADLDHTLRVQVTAKNDYGSTVNESKATVVVKPATVPAVTTTIAASRTTTICCQTIRLSGHVSSNKAGEPVVIIGREFDAGVTDTVAKTVSDPSGNWSAVVRPTIATTYIAQTSTSKSQPISVGVHPRVGFGISGNNFSAKITGRDTFAGAIAYFQVRSGSTWRSRAVIVVNTFSVARFHVSLKRGRTYTVRIYLPQRQAGPGYLDGSSHIRRVGGNS
ncbi:MAG: hypothetical protein H0V07_02270 [Propionibacteriales bacterium]|nr:hypothetical protein [Propionibacteriales bacterium]